MSPVAGGGGPVECFTVAINGELAIVDPAFGAQPIGMAHFVVEAVNKALFLGVELCLPQLASQVL